MASCVARDAGVNWPVIEAIRGRGWRIEQIPSCPELVLAGAERGWKSRAEYGSPAFLPHFIGVAATAADMIAWRLGRGEDAVLYGVEGSPSTGVHVAWDRREGTDEDGFLQVQPQPALSPRAWQVSITAPRAPRRRGSSFLGGGRRRRRWRFGCGSGSRVW